MREVILFSLYFFVWSWSPSDHYFVVKDFTIIGERTILSEYLVSNRGIIFLHVKNGMIQNQPCHHILLDFRDMRSYCINNELKVVTKSKDLLHGGWTRDPIIASDTTINYVGKNKYLATINNTAESPIGTIELINHAEVKKIEELEKMIDTEYLRYLPFYFGFFEGTPLFLSIQYSPNRPIQQDSKIESRKIQYEIRSDNRFQNFLDKLEVGE